jgi:glycosyltransferase involved in cell wall biosynthesis/nucleotide-binding universal stress UspA family protein
MPRRHSEFTPIHSIIVPLVHEGPGLHALNIARLFDVEISLVGVVVVPRDQSLSTGAAAARAVRRSLRNFEREKCITGKSRVIVSYEPWHELSKMVQHEKPDLLLLEFESHLKALHVTLSTVLTRPPCDVALVRGKSTGKPNQVLVPMRGGPHAELALRVSLGLHSNEVETLHIRQPEGQDASRDAAFKGLDRVLGQLPEVRKQVEVTEDAAKVILQHAKHKDIVVMGTTAQPRRSSVSLGPVADRILREAPCTVIAVKSGRPLPYTAYDERVGLQAISILVDKWFAENTFHADEFNHLRDLVRTKREQGVSISLALPALNEEETVGKIIRTLKKELMERTGLLDEIVLIDSNSIDQTREVAKREGIPVYIHQHLLGNMGMRLGKGEALWKSLLVTRGDIIVWIDTDIVNIHPRFVYGIIGPLLQNPQIQLAKGFYRRPLKVGQKMQARGGGRVTELTARPLLNLFYPELSGVIQPLSGEYGGRRSALEQATFFSGYGVETGLLIDIYERHGLSAIAQVDLLERVHHNQHLEALSKMSFAIIQTVMRKLEKRFGRAVLEDVNRSMKLIRHDDKGYFLDVEEIAEHERPPMLEVEEYRSLFKREAVTNNQRVYIR